MAGAEQVLARGIGGAVAVWALRGAWQSVRAARRDARLEDYVLKVHGTSDNPRQATLGDGLAMFWLGELFAKHGTDDQLERWYRILHGPVGGQ